MIDMQHADYSALISHNGPANLSPTSYAAPGVLRPAINRFLPCFMGGLFSLVSLGFMGAFLSVASSKYPNGHPEIHFPTKPALIAVRKHKDSDEIEHLSLRTLIETRCQSLFKEFKPLWWLFKCVPLLSILMNP